MKTLRGVYKVTTADQFQLQKINLELLLFLVSVKNIFM